MQHAAGHHPGTIQIHAAVWFMSDAAAFDDAHIGDPNEWTIVAAEV